VGEGIIWVSFSVSGVRSRGYLATYLTSDFIVRPVPPVLFVGRDYARFLVKVGGGCYICMCGCKEFTVEGFLRHLPHSTHLYTYIRVCVYVYLFFVHVYVYSCICLYMYVCTCVYVYLSLYLCVHVYAFTCMCMHVHVRVRDFWSRV
jgi:hypothetical protein